MTCQCFPSPHQSFTSSMSDSDKFFFQPCVCGHMFTGLNAFTWHEKSCVKGKKCLSGALSRAKEAYQKKKVHIQGPVDSDQAGVLEADPPVEWRQLALHHSQKFQAKTDERLDGTESDRVCVQHFGQGSY